MKKNKIPVIVLLVLAGATAVLIAQSPSPSQVSASAAPSPSATPAHASDPFVKGQGAKPPADAAPPVNICFTVEVYALPQADAGKLLEEIPGGEARHARVLELVAAGKARFETLLSDVTKSGQRTVVEQVDEVRYPTQYEPSPMPGEPTLPTAYETCNVGETLEYEPVLSPDNSVCDISMALGSVRFHGFSEFRGLTQGAPVAQPQFDTRKFTAAMTLIAGKIQFLGTQSAPPQFTETGAGAANPPEVRVVFGRISVVTTSPASLQAKEEGPTLEHQLVFYSMDRDAARQILAGDPKPGSYYDAVRALADKQQAHLERVTVLQTKSGQRAVAEEINEFRYPTEYGIFHKNKHNDEEEKSIPPPGSVPPPVTSSSANPAPTTPNVTIGPIGPVEISLGSGAANKPGSDLEYLPASFETRNTGLTLELEPVVNKSIVDMNLSPQWTANIGPLQANGIAGKYPLIPVFEDGKVTTSLTASIGEHAFIGTFSPAGDNGVNGKKDTGKVWLGFIRTTYAQP